MKKTAYLITSVILLIFINSCAGYKPIYTTELNFEITDYSLKNDKKLGKKIYSKLYNLSKRSKNSKDDPQTAKIIMIIDTTKNKTSMSKDTTGKVLEYKIEITSNIQIKDYFSVDEMVNQTFSYSSLYQVQTQYSETINLENKNIENIIDKIFQNILIKMSDSLISK